MYTSGLLLFIVGGVAVVLYGDVSPDMFPIVLTFSFVLLPLASILGILVSARPTPAVFTEEGIVAPTVLLDQVLHGEPEFIPYDRIDHAVRQSLAGSRPNRAMIMVVYRRASGRTRMMDLGEGRDFPPGAVDHVLDTLSARGIRTSRIDGPLVPSLRRMLKERQRARR